MKVGYKHKTTVSGDDSERFAAQFYLMYNNPNGSLRPDLISINGRYNPKLSFECKSGKDYKGVMVISQLHYSMTANEDYEGLFGDDFSDELGLLPGIKGNLQHQNVSYYYNFISRWDRLKAKDLNRPFSAIKFRWGSQFMVPGDYGFYNFAINMARRTGDSVPTCVSKLKKIVKEDIMKGSSNYLARVKDRQSWQDLHGRDILSIWLNGRKSGSSELGADITDRFDSTSKILTMDGRERVDLMEKYYPDFHNLKRILIPAQDGTNIYVLAKPADFNLMNRQLRRVVNERRPIIQKLVEEREEAVHLLDKMETRSYGLYENGDVPKDVQLKLNLTQEEFRLLKRLTMWMPEKEFAGTIYDPTKKEDLDPGTVPF